MPGCSQRLQAPSVGTTDSLVAGIAPGNVVPMNGKLRKIRERKKLTQVALCKRAKLTQGYLSLLESGTKTSPSIAVMKRLAKALGVPVAELL